MRFVAFSPDSPAENLAVDEVLLRAAADGGAETLRIWESPSRFVVIGVGQQLEVEAHTAHCDADGVPYLRRCTAGGCVLQGPGCLNYTLALRIEGRSELATVRASYCAILCALSEALRARGIEAAHAGISDLASGGRKVSGNAQKRVRNALLHHGTLLYRADYGAMARYLKEPADRPDYRGERRHEEFVGEIALPPNALREAVVEAFAPGAAAEELSAAEAAAAQELAASKYSQAEWTRRR